LTKDQLLAEIDEVIRTMPPRAEIRKQTPSNMAWFGRAFAALNKWNSIQAIYAQQYVDEIFNVRIAPDLNNGLARYSMVLHQAHNDLRMEIGSSPAVVGQGMVFEYFDAVRKIIETASVDILFVDPYLDAEFVSRYLFHVRAGTRIRLLGRHKVDSLTAALDMWTRQTGSMVELRLSANLHDRYVIVDGSCYQSGASFKDGAKAAPTTLTQITDAGPAVIQAYEKIWDAGQVVR
jgi:hypothetical protein